MNIPNWHPHKWSFHRLEFDPDIDEVVEIASDRRSRLIDNGMKADEASAYAAGFIEGYKEHRDKAKASE